MANARHALEKVLDALGESAHFVAAGSLAPVLSGLEVVGVGAIGTPVTAAAARQLIAAANQAPYGRGEKTIVDTDVRRVWQIDPANIEIRNAEWHKHVAAIVETVKQEFGIQQKVTAELYKLLVYEKGSFFAPHRDSEKSKGMFATLVVCLPSRHEGGTLLVKHDGQTKKIDFGGNEAEFNTQYAAFYADCEHEITAVTAGYRICLVYNLAIAGKKSQPSAPQNAAAVEKTAKLLKDVFAEAPAELSKIVIPFQHQYTEAGVDPTQLKGSDRARADVLVRAAKALDYQCYLALLTHHQSGDVDYSTWDFGYSRRRRYRYSDEDRDDSGVEIGEIYNQEMTLDHWLDPQGRKQPFGTLSFEESELLDPEGREHWPFRQEVHEATGNEGVSVDRWYHQAALVIWPRERYFGILAGEGPASAVPALAKLAGRGKKLADPDACRTFAAQIIDRWKPRQGITAYRAESESGTMLKLLERIGDMKLAQRFLGDVLPKDFDGSEGKPLQALCQRLGWESLASLLRAFFAQQNPANYVIQLDKIVAICEALCCEPPDLTEERRAVCVALAEELTQVLERWDAQPTHAWYRRETQRAGVTAKVVRIFATVGAMASLERFVEHALADKENYDLHQALIPDVLAIHKWLATVPAAQPAAAELLAHCLAELRVATAQPIVLPTDWARDDNIACKCADCKLVNVFLRDPEQRVGRFPMAKTRRQHLHNQLDRHHCDVTHVTERKGSPQTLVCTKTVASYERRQKQYEVDMKLLAELEAIEQGGRRTAVRRSATRKRTKAIR